MWVKYFQFLFFIQSIIFSSCIIRKQCCILYFTCSSVMAPISAARLPCCPANKFLPSLTCLFSSCACSSSFCSVSSEIKISRQTSEFVFVFLSVVCPVILHSIYPQLTPVFCPDLSNLCLLLPDMSSHHLRHLHSCLSIFPRLSFTLLGNSSSQNYDLNTLFSLTISSQDIYLLCLFLDKAAIGLLLLPPLFLLPFLVLLNHQQLVMFPH